MKRHMNRRSKLTLLLGVLAVLPASAGRADSSPESWSLQYKQGRPVSQAEPGVRGQQVELGPLTGEIYVYATFEAQPTNPIPYAGGQAKPEPQQQAFVVPESYLPPAAFHTYRVVREGGTAELYIDGQLKLKTDTGDGSIVPSPWTPVKVSAYPLAFGNEPSGKLYR
jgi:hypothetical protein